MIRQTLLALALVAAPALAQQPAAHTTTAQHPDTTKAKSHRTRRAAHTRTTKAKPAAAPRDTTTKP